MSGEQDVPVVADPDRSHPVPTAWRPTFEAIVTSFVAGDFQPQHPNVVPVSDQTARQAREYVADYGEVLVVLTPETWETSVAQWMVDRRWDVLVDLRTESEGRSDLVLQAFVDDRGDDHAIEVHLVYVP